MNPHPNAVAADEAKSVCILAAKDLRTNTRVARQARALTAAGWRVTVAALELPALVDDEADGQADGKADAVRINVAHPLQAIDGGDAPGGGAGQTSPVDAVGRKPATSWRRVAAGIARTVAMPFGHSINSLRFAAAAADALRGHRFDVVQAHDAPALRAAYRLARSCGAFLVYDAVEYVDSRAMFLDGAVARAVRRLESAREARLIRRASACLAIGPCMSEWMTRRYGIPPPIVVRNCRLLEDPPADDTLRRAAGIDSNAVIVLYVNTIYPGRGLELLLEAMTQLDPAVHLVILGDRGTSTYARQVREHAAAGGLDGRLHFVPPCAPHELVALASGADVGVIPFQNTSMNHYYALPNRLFEMIMARLPVAASAFPEMQALIEAHGIGTTFDPESATSIAAALRGLLAPAARAQLARKLDEAAAILNWERESVTYVAALRALDRG